MKRIALFTGLILSTFAAGQQVTSSPAPAISDARPAAVPPSAGLPNLPTMPQGKASLFGGTIRTLDQLRDRITIEPFGGGKVKILFDARTLVDRDGEPILTRNLKPGDRVYLETVLEKTDVFARRIHVVSKVNHGQSEGQVVDYRPAKGEFTLRDVLSEKPIKMRLSASSMVMDGDKAVPAAQLQEGSLVSVDFLPSAAGDPVVSKISIIAKPGASFQFSGRVVHLDLKAGILVLLDPRDSKNYQINLDPAILGQNDLHEGSDITAITAFDGNQYTAKSIVIHPPANDTPKQ